MISNDIANSAVYVSAPFVDDAHGHSNDLGCALVCLTGSAICPALLGWSQGSSVSLSRSRSHSHSRNRIWSRRVGVGTAIPRLRKPSRKPSGLISRSAEPEWQLSGAPYRVRAALDPHLFTPDSLPHSVSPNFWLWLYHWRHDTGGIWDWLGTRAVQDDSRPLGSVMNTLRLGRIPGNGQGEVKSRIWVWYWEDGNEILENERMTGGVERCEYSYNDGAIAIVRQPWLIFNRIIAGGWACKPSPLFRLAKSKQKT